MYDYNIFNRLNNNFLHKEFFCMRLQRYWNYIRNECIRLHGIRGHAGTEEYTFDMFSIDEPHINAHNLMLASFP